MPDGGDAGQSHKNPAENTERDSSAPSTIPTSRPNEPSRREIAGETNDQEKRSKWGNGPDTWMVILTAILMSVGIVTAWIFFQQFREMSKQTALLNAQARQAIIDATEASKRVDRQLAITREQADAAQQSVKAIQGQMRQDQRAWIEVHYGTPNIVSDQQGSIPIVFKNVGKTPARSIEEFVCLQILPINKKVDLSSDTVRPQLTSHEGIMTPQSEDTLVATTMKTDPANRTRTLPLILQKDDIDNLSSGKTYYVIYGIVRYRDIFNTLHWMKFCNWNAAYNIAVPAGECAEFNSVDQNEPSHE
jgi:hypothetical protein